MARLGLVAAALVAAGCLPTIKNPRGFCERDLDCPVGSSCVARRCAAPCDRDLGLGADGGCACAGDGECGPSGRCAGGRCVAAAPASCALDGGPTPVKVDGGCICTGVRGSDTCRVDGRVCESGACVACSRGDQCPDNHCCSVASGRCVALGWSELKPQGDLPAPRYDHVLLLDGTGGRLLLFGGNDRSNGMPGWLGDLWELKLGGTLFWQRLDLLQPPGARSSHVGAIEPTSRRAIFATGYRGPMEGGGYVMDLPALDLRPSPPVWMRTNPGPGPKPRSASTMVADPAGKRLILFGGNVDPSPAGDLWAYHDDPPRWSELLPAAPSPSPRYHPAVAYDATRRELYVHGGADNRSTLGDLWVLELAVEPPRWRRVGTVAERPNYYHAMALVPGTRQLVIFGGFDNNGLPTSATWSLALDGPGDLAWTRLTPVGEAPPPRRGHSLLFDEAGQRLLVFGGDDLKSVRNDLFALAFPACR